MTTSSAIYHGNSGGFLLLQRDNSHYTITFGVSPATTGHRKEGKKDNMLILL
jgi:hypothetical protein